MSQISATNRVKKKNLCIPWLSGEKYISIDILHVDDLDEFRKL